MIENCIELEAITNIQCPFFFYSPFVDCFCAYQLVAFAEYEMLGLQSQITANPLPVSSMQSDLVLDTFDEYIRSV